MENSVLKIPTSSIMLHEPVSYRQLVTGACSNEEVEIIFSIFIFSISTEVDVSVR